MSLFGKIFGKKNTSINLDERRKQELQQYWREEAERDKDKLEYDNNIRDAITGDAAAQVVVGKYCAKYVDLYTAFEWFKKAADQDNAEALEKVGCAYLDGNGVEKNEEKGIFYLKCSAEQNNIDAIYRLGTEYLNGFSVDKDIDEALRYLTKAAERGECFSEGQLGILYYEGKDVPQDGEKAFYWLNRSMNGDDTYIAGYHFALCYLYGVGVKKDEKKGIDLLKQCVENNCLYYMNAKNLLEEYTCGGRQKGQRQQSSVQSGSDDKISRLAALMAEENGWDE